MSTTQSTNEDATPMGAQDESGAAAGATTFADLGLSPAVMRAVEDLGYEQPTPVQAQAIPEVLAGKDLLAAAQTGTGKTAAFLLPAMSQLPRMPRRQGPGMLVVTPTRELAQQIEDVCKTVANRTHHHSVTVVGGVSYNPQTSALRRGCDVLVATPGRLVDLMDRGVCHLGNVQVLVLDEADRMLDMGFLPSMRKIVSQTPEDRQTLLFSATLDEKAIGGIRDLVHEPAIVEIAHKGTVAETIDQYVLPVGTEVKNGLLIDVLKRYGTQRVIVFCRTKHRADACCKRLRRAGVKAAPIHGDRTQKQRQRALADFRDGRVDALVATDVLARGIDVSDVSYVINFDVPEDPEDYIHRIGRTGRAGEDGWALTFVTNQDKNDLFDIERLMGKVVPTFEADEALDLGEDAPELDPDRSCETNKRGRRKRPRNKGGEKRGGRRREGSRGGRDDARGEGRAESGHEERRGEARREERRHESEGRRHEGSFEGESFGEGHDDRRRSNRNGGERGEGSRRRQGGQGSRGEGRGGEHRGSSQGRGEDRRSGSRGSYGRGDGRGSSYDERRDGGRGGRDDRRGGSRSSRDGGFNLGGSGSGKGGNRSERRRAQFGEGPKRRSGGRRPGDGRGRSRGVY